MNKYKKLYFIGIKGVAMTALAILAKEQGLIVTGSDIEETFITDEILNKNNIFWRKGFKPNNLPKDADLVIVTGAHGGMTNPETQEALRLGKKTLMHGQALGLFMEGHRQICVAGSHGKTTTSALLAFLFEQIGYQPSFAIGCAKINPLGNPGRFGSSEYFIAEADEYATCPLTDLTPRFLWQDPDLLVVTNIEYDHPDIYPSLDEIKAAFISLLKKMKKKSKVIICLDNKNTAELLPYCQNPLTYGQSSKADYIFHPLGYSNGRQSLRLFHKERDLGVFQISLVGEHNCSNAVASIIIALEENIEIEKIRDLLPLFLGTKRRFEKKVEIGGVKAYDDYAHHPTEIKSTLKAAKNLVQGKVICLFQPHTLSRTTALFNDFISSFSAADRLIISKVYKSNRESNDKDNVSLKFYKEILLKHPSAIYAENIEDAALQAVNLSSPGDLLLTMGAGDIYKAHEIIKNSLHHKYDK